MSIFRLTWQDQPPAECRRGVLAIGNYDGVHRGHLALLAALKTRAGALEGPAVAMTFDPHPLQLLRPDQFQPVLTTVSRRAELVQANGPDHVVILTTTPELLALRAGAFFDEVVCRRLAARALVEGPNFGFGHDREGDVHTLEVLSRQAGLEPPLIVPAVRVDGLPVSSSRVRSALLQGQVREAAGLLGRPYRLEGTVVSGQRRGQTLGFPTANLDEVPTVIPGDGVYAVRATQSGQAWPGAVNIGPNPTFGEQARKVEVHLIGFQGELYGKTLTVDFMERLRDTRRFSGRDQLMAQLQNDVDQARRLVAAAVL
jgi:riboflavin kinase/FMN adenylyltransferase